MGRSVSETRTNRVTLKSEPRGSPNLNDQGLAIKKWEPVAFTTGGKYASTSVELLELGSGRSRPCMITIVFASFTAS